MGGRGASSGSTGINNEMTRIRNLLKNFDYVNAREANEFIEDVKDTIAEAKELYEEREITDKEQLQKKMRRRLRNHIGGRYMFQNGKHNDEIMDISEKIAKKIYK
ncbi:MAG: hypothetical protein KHW50_07365 [Clostridium sp.]|nr:hypothetical protein [Clostridium sp.]